MENNIGKIKRPEIIRNLPYRKTLNARFKNLRQELQISSNTPIILYQGSISYGRGLKVLVSAMERITHPSAVLVLLGNGILSSELKKLAEAKHVLHRVYFHSAVMPDILPEWTSEATLGISSIEPICLSYKLCLPNKLFEYIQAGLPVIVSNLPEMEKTVKENNIGEIFESGNTEDLAEKIDNILNNPHLLAKYQKMVKKAAQKFCWEKEKIRLMNIYENCLNGSKRR